MSKRHWTHPKGKPEYDYAEIILTMVPPERAHRWTDERIAKITFVPVREVARMRARLQQGVAR